MEPITVMLLAAVITKMITTHQEDMEYARHGQDSPRYKLKMAKLAADRQQGKASAVAPSRPGAGGYMKELWADAWESANAHREKKRQARRAGWDQEIESLKAWSKRSLNTREDGKPVDAAPVDDMLDVADVRPTPKPAPATVGTDPAPDETAWINEDKKKCTRCKTGLVGEAANKEAYCTGCGWLSDPWPAPQADDGFRADQKIDMFDLEMAGDSTAPDEAITGLTDPDAHLHRTNAARQRWATENPPGPLEFVRGWRCVMCGASQDGLTEEGAARLAAEHRCAHLNAGDGDTSNDVIAALAGSSGLLQDVAECGACRQAFRQVGNEMRCGCANRPPIQIPDSMTSRPEQPAGATIIQFPTTKEIDMTNAEATGLSTAIAFAEAAAQGHATFATAGSEGYAGALERLGFGPRIIAQAGEAREQSTIATAKWQQLAEDMKNFQPGQEFYTSNPDAPDKQALINE